MLWCIVLSGFLSRFVFFGVFLVSQHPEGRESEVTPSGCSFIPGFYTDFYPCIFEAQKKRPEQVTSKDFSSKNKHNMASGKDNMA